MTDYANQIVAAKMQQLNTRINARMREISSQTGIQFSEMFAQKLNTAAQTGEVPGGADGMDITEAVETEAAAEESVQMSDARRTGYDGIIAEAAERYGLDSRLVRAVVWAESNFDSNCVSGAGAMGLMQLMPATAALLGVSDAFDPGQNIDGGARYLADRVKLYDGDIMLALAAYNCGAGGLSSRGITDLSDPGQFSKLPRETRNYLTRIEGYLESLGVSDMLSQALR